MPTQIKVLKQFTLSLGRPKPAEGQFDNRLAITRVFTVGDHVLADDDEALEHPFIVRDYADGCIESPQQARKRIADEEKKVAARNEADRQIQADAEAKFKRLVSAIDGPQAKLDAKAIEEELHTPVDKINAKRATGKK